MTLTCRRCQAPAVDVRKRITSDSVGVAKPSRPSRNKKRGGFGKSGAVTSRAL